MAVDRQLALLRVPSEAASLLEDSNKVKPEDRAVHEWYRFVLSFPPHLVSHYLNRFALEQGQRVLDPFCGTGTTLVECKKVGIASVGIEANPMASFASRVKVDWHPDAEGLVGHALKIVDLTLETLSGDLRAELRSLSPDLTKLLLRGSISPLPLHKVLVLLEVLTRHQDVRFIAHERLALAKTIVFAASNLEFGPEVGVGAPKPDSPVVEKWLEAVQVMAKDLEEMKDTMGTESLVHCADSRSPSRFLEDGSIDAVITSPPYPNEKDYTRTTRLESVILGFIRSKEDLRALKQELVKSNTRGVYKADRDDILVNDHDEIQDIAEAIEQRRLELGKTSGFERLYSRVTRLYFGGMHRHLSALRQALRPGAHLAYVVGDQASYLRVMIRTGKLLSDIAESLGYEVVARDLFRTRLATATKEQLREEVIILRWPGRMTITRGAFMTQRNRYSAIIARIFESKYISGAKQVDFERDDIVRVAQELNIELPKNLGDLIYSFRYRTALPASIQAAGGEDVWIIRPAGRARYRFMLVPNRPIAPNASMVATKVPDATPGVVAKYALSDEQALLARLRYNRLIDIFTGVTCYSLQNHLRTYVPEMGQVETDELYAGVDKKGAHYVIPVQAKGGRDRISVVQIEQDMAVCASKFPSLICRPIAAQFMPGDTIAMFEFEEGNEGVGIVSEKHYRLVRPEDVSDEDLDRYRTRG